jgi:hypothetical protein
MANLLGFLFLNKNLISKYCLRIITINSANRGQVTQSWSHVSSGLKPFSELPSRTAHSEAKAIGDARHWGGGWWVWR